MTEDYCYKNEIIEVLYKKKKDFILFIYFIDTTDKNLGELQTHYCPGFGIIAQQHLCADSLALIYSGVT